MAFDELKENFAEAEASAKSYLDSTRQFYKLKGFKMLMKAILIFAKIATVGLVLVMALLFLSISAAHWIGAELESTAKGFFIVGLLYILIGILLYLMRHKLRKPLLKKFSEFYFDET